MDLQKLVRLALSNNQTQLLMTMLRDDVVYKHQRCHLAETILDNMGEGGDEALRTECIRTCAVTWRARNEQVIGLVGEKGR